MPDPLYRLTLLPPPARAFLSHGVGFEPAGVVYGRSQLGRQLAQGPSSDVSLPVLEDRLPLQGLLGGLHGAPPVPSLRPGPTSRAHRRRREAAADAGMGRRGCPDVPGREIRVSVSRPGEPGEVEGPIVVERRTAHLERRMADSDTGRARRERLRLPTGHYDGPAPPLRSARAPTDRSRRSPWPPATCARANGSPGLSRNARITRASARSSLRSTGVVTTVVRPSGSGGGRSKSSGGSKSDSG